MTREKKPYDRSMKKIAKLITAAAGITTLTAGIPSIAAASVTAPMNNPVGVKQHIQNYLSERFPNGLHAGESFSIAWNDIFEESSTLEYTIIVQNDSVADVKEWSGLGSLRIGLKKQGTTMVNIVAKRRGEQASVYHERFRLTAAAPVGLDSNGDGAGIDDVVKYFKAHPERFTQAEDYRRLLQAAVDSTVTVPNRAPVSSDNTEEVSLFAGSSISLDMNDYFRDEDGDLLTYSLQVQPQNGGGAANVTLSGDGKLEIEGLNQSPNPVRATVTAGDGGLTASHSFIITVSKFNHAPVAESGALSVIEDTSATGTLVGSDADGDALTYRIDKQGTKGVVTITNASTGEYTYVPHPNANGSDTFEFIVNDGKADSAKATISVTIQPVEDPIVVDPNNQLGINNDGIITLSKNQSVAIDMTRVFSNPDKKKVDYRYSEGSGLDIHMESDGYLIIRADEEYTTADSYSVGLEVKERGESNEWFTHYITVNITEEEDLGNQSMNPDPLTAIDLPLANYFVLGGSNAWTLSVWNKDAATGSLSASITGTTLSLHGLADGASKLAVNLNDGHGSIISDEMIVYVGNWIPHDVGNVFMRFSETPYYHAQIDLNKIFYGATEYRVLETDDANIHSVSKPLLSWFSSESGHTLYVDLAESTPTTMTVEARNEFGQTAVYVVHMVWNNPPVYIGDHEPIIIRKGDTYLLNMLDPVRFEDPDGDELVFNAFIDDVTRAEVGEPSGSIIPIYGSEVGASHLFLEASDGVNVIDIYPDIPIAVLGAQDEYVKFNHTWVKSLDISTHLSGLTGPYTVSVSENDSIQSADITGSTLTLTAYPQYDNDQSDMVKVTVSDGTAIREFNIYVFIPSRLPH
ncbi:hypothetical protein PAECIP111893_05280 [Paenibacillus plantiphilus]|uniref:Cadherin domain-containing protein n=1 Tax=Paenibacillus plantiphilus TaxID=2905650 RepID=A0ABN8H3C0_9BACL|nr:Ig-like domain-containing protein [Paenibacillus plantiphilus]CAH1225622.1 hypothetical protein PAECIP111893_05280 [Paenibacillus plantiphilus]